MTRVSEINHNQHSWQGERLTEYGNNFAGLITVINLSEYEPPHDKTNKMTVCPAKTQISLGICPVIYAHKGHSEGSDQTGRMPRLI